MPKRPLRPGKSLQRQAFGLTILRSGHPEVQHLQRHGVAPSLHGQKMWSTSFLLMHYLRERGLAPGTRVLELGCGWGLVGIYCAKEFQAQVTGLDADAAVFPYLQLHAHHNGVEIATRHCTFAELPAAELAAFDLIVGVDICFWDELVDPLYQIVRHGMAAGVTEILLADPSRPPFDDLCKRCVAQGNAEVFLWDMRKPVLESGRILRVGGQRGASRRPAPGLSTRSKR